jgi:hypothetical protein
MTQRLDIGWVMAGYCLNNTWQTPAEAMTNTPMAGYWLDNGWEQAHMGSIHACFHFFFGHFSANIQPISSRWEKQKRAARGIETMFGHFPAIMQTLSSH